MTPALLGSIVGFCMVAAAVAAQGGAQAPVLPRTIEGLLGLVWWFLAGYSFAGWIVANLKTAVVAMNGDGRRSETWAGIISSLVASGVAGVSVGLYVLTEAKWDDKPVSALYAYFAAAIAAYGGQKFWDLGVTLIQAAAERVANRNVSGGPP